MSRSNRSINLIVWTVISALFLTSFTYQDLPIDKEGQKKLAKANGLNQSAQELIDKANALYSDIAGIEEEGKRIEKQKAKALDYQLDALKLQKEANFLQYNVYKNIIPKLKDSYSKHHAITSEVKLIEENADEQFYKAETLRNEAYQYDKKDKENRYSKLSEAQENEKSGIKELENLIDIYLGIKTIDKTSELDLKKSLPEGVEINEKLLKSYLNYIKNGDSLSAYQLVRNIFLSDSLNSSNFSSAWNSYIYPDADTAKAIDYMEELSNEDVEIVSENVKEQTKTQSVLGNQAEKPSSKNKIYKVLITGKEPLSQNVLQKIYADKKEVKMVKEDGWNKYSIGDFNSYEEADKFRKSIGVNGAFVEAYEDGNKIDILENKMEPKAAVVKTSSNKPGIVYKVQIAADRFGLTTEMLNNLYSGDEKIDMVKEDGWLKYSVGRLNSYKEAVQLKKSVDVRGAFIVAYKDGAKVPLYLARKGKIQNSVESHGEIVFRVQIAADSKTLTSEKLHEIYSGYETIDKFEEDGWYKYAIGSFNTFNEANELRKSCGVNGAFVIAFQGNRKINVLAAKKMQNCYTPNIITDWRKENTEIVFRIQIAASSTRLSAEQVKNIYCKESEVFLFEENGWFKYSTGAFDSYKDAAAVKEKIGVKGAFIVAFKNGKKLNIKEAIKISNK